MNNFATKKTDIKGSSVKNAPLVTSKPPNTFAANAKEAIQ